jgi:hypothetical protein
MTRRQCPAWAQPPQYAASTGPCSCCSIRDMNELCSCCSSCCCPCCSCCCCALRHSATRWSSLPRQLKVAFSSTSSALATCHSREELEEGSGSGTAVAAAWPAGWSAGLSLTKSNALPDAACLPWLRCWLPGPCVLPAGSCIASSACMAARRCSACAAYCWHQCATQPASLPIRPYLLMLALRRSTNCSLAPATVSLPSLSAASTRAWVVTAGGGVKGGVASRCQRAAWVHGAGASHMVPQQRSCAAATDSH